jgi:hypothetical protein
LEKKQKKSWTTIPLLLSLEALFLEGDLLVSYHNERSIELWHEELFDILGEQALSQKSAAAVGAAERKNLLTKMAEAATRECTSVRHTKCTNRRKCKLVMCVMKARQNVLRSIFD